MRRRTIFLSIIAGMAVLIASATVHDFLPSARAAEMTVHKDPNCGCCSKWIQHMEAAGFTVKAKDTAEMAGIKADFGVPSALYSCHTTTIDGYVIEGHVPAADIARLLSERPAALGLAVPGMPAGSPGMEQGSRREPYQVILFGADGKQSVFARH